MFGNLTDKLQEAFRHLRGVSSITESNISETMGGIRDALLEADVNVEVAEDFVKQVTAECLGDKVLKSVTPGQMAVKIVNDKLTEFMGATESALAEGGKPTVIMMVGLHGSGKTTTTAKLALLLKKKGKKVLLAAGDVYRPAAIDQLEVLGEQTGVEVYSDRGNSNVPALAATALEKAKNTGCDYLIIDTAGRLEIDENMVRELVLVSQTVHADEILLVADSALGQAAVSVARHFNDALHITGIVLTKLDGDSRGGAALSIRKVTDRPVKFVGLGEKLEDLDVFHPERMAGRILGMGDIVSLVEKAAEEIDREEAEKLEAKLRKSEFDFDDFLVQLRQMSRMGGVASILKFLPGGDKLANIPQLDDGQFRRMEAIICSMNRKERANADIIDMSRRKRIAKGCGRKVEEVSQLINQFNMMRKLMKNSGILNSLLGGGGGGLGSMLGGMGGMPGMGSGTGGMGRGSNFTPPKKKRRK